MFFCFSLIAKRILGKRNELADAISCGNLELLFKQVSEAVENRERIFPELLDLLVFKQPDWTSPVLTQLFGSCFCGLAKSLQAVYRSGSMRYL